MRALFLAWSTCPILSPGVPFYRPRGGTGLHGARTNMDYGMGEDVVKPRHPYQHGSMGLVATYLAMMAHASFCVR